MTDYKNTLNLPQTDFPMKGDLAKREPNILDIWEQTHIYSQLRQKGSHRKKFILHDGPPYANGHIHIGHALNKTLKDIINKAKTLSGFDTPFVPGWDCHGLPIELNVEKKFGKVGEKINATEFRKACREYAKSQIDIQRKEFKRLGIFGDWENPYATMDYHYEADVIRALGKIIEKGHLLRGSKPVYWCVDCGSALAEAEVEYKNKMSFAIDVKFKSINAEEIFSRLSHQVPAFPVSIPIWTTTPWTLPANQAVTVHPEVEYGLVKVESERGTEYLLLAIPLIESVMKRLGIEHYPILASCLGEALEHVQLQHPFLDRPVPILLGEHVTVEAGTGAVHTAPAHGQEDYVVGSRYGLPIYNPVNGKGCFNEDTPFFAGEHVFKVNEHVLQVLEDHQTLLHVEKIEHSYPHCWRHKTPLIFRATPQWFISMDQEKLRTKSLASIDQVRWIPEWGHARMAEMILQRPDWCISRQRIWGTPLPLFVHRTTGELHPDTPDLMEKVAQRVEEKGIDVWYELESKDLISDASDYEKVHDVLDVWFDSGVSHMAVLLHRSELRWPADVYLEGSDQFRGWFQSSLLTGIAIKEHSPYKTVLTHGYTIDLQGRKMSKSLGNVIPPEKIWNSLGADILRLWAASIDYRGDINYSEEIFKRNSEAYRRIRNTARYLLANLFDFTPEQCLPYSELVALDKWAIDRTRLLQEEIIKAYDDFQFHMVCQKIQHFCTIDMGSFYFEIIKDRQYTTGKNSKPRRSTQTAMYYILEALVRWLAPILSFTAEDIWQFIPWKQVSSVFLTTWLQDIPALATNDPLDQAFWLQLIQIRDQVNRELERARNAGHIGSGLEAQVNLYADEKIEKLLSQIGDELRFVLITSYAKVLPASHRDEAATPTEIEGLWIKVEACQYNKCARCWHLREDVGMFAEHSDICGRCVENIEGKGEIRKFA